MIHRGSQRLSVRNEWSELMSFSPNSDLKKSIFLLTLYFFWYTCAHFPGKTMPQIPMEHDTHAHTHTLDISHIFLTSLKLPIFAPESCDGDAGEHLLGVPIVAVPSNFPLPQDGSCPHNVHVSYFHMLFGWEKGFSVAKTTILVVHITYMSCFWNAKPTSFYLYSNSCWLRPWWFVYQLLLGRIPKFCWLKFA